MEITVVVPTFGRVDALLATLARLEQSSYPVDRFEVVVVDDGSRDRTVELVQKWIGASRLNARLVQQRNQGPAVARNAGAREAGGEFLIFLDNDILTAPTFLELHLNALRKYPGAWIVNRVLNTPDVRQTPFGRYRDALNLSFQPPEGGGVVEVDGATGQGWSMRRDEFFAVGGFDERFEIASCEDWDLAFRAKKMGFRTVHHPGIVVEHADWAVDLRSYCQRQRSYSVSDVLLWAKYSGLTPRARLVRANGPVDLDHDHPGSVALKVLKQALTIAGAGELVLLLAGQLERLFPDSPASHRAYRMAISLHIFSGVREGFKRLGH